jgi:L-methionine (R)-S-oxide reductase
MGSDANMIGNYKTQRYSEARKRIESTLADDRRPITVMAAVAAILKETFSHFYWVGFLLVEDSEMAVGPFQGPPSCLRLPLNSTGVCGTCYRTARTILVPDVATFQGRIACHVTAKSEIAVPIIVSERVVAVLDVDCTELSGVDKVDTHRIGE